MRTPKKGDRVKIKKTEEDREEFVGQTGILKAIYGETVWVKFGKSMDLQWFYKDEVEAV